MRNRTNNNLNPLDSFYLRRPPECPQRVDLMRCLIIRVRGAFDGHRGLPLINDLLDATDQDFGIYDTVAAPRLSTQWITSNRKAAEEAMNRELHDAHSMAALEIRDLAELGLKLDQLNARLSELRQQAAAAASKPAPVSGEIIAGPSERDVPASVLLKRRTAAWTRPSAAANALVSAKQNEIAALQNRAAGLVAAITTAFTNAVTRAHSARFQYEQRASIYKRAVTRWHPQGRQLQQLLGDSVTITAPSWTEGPCPWIPKAWHPTA